MLKIIKEIIKLKTKSYLIFRVDILFNFLSQMLFIFFYILLFRIIFLKVESIGGWKESEVLVLLGTYYLLNELHGRLFRNGLYKFPEIIMGGTLENYLIRPINVPLFLLLSEVDWPSLRSYKIYISYLYTCYSIYKFPYKDYIE